MSKVKQGQVRQLLASIALLGCALALSANLLCAFLYDAVFLDVPHTIRWVYSRTSPLSFWLSVAMSSFGAPALALIGVLGLKDARNGRHILERLYPARPKYDDDSHASRT